MQAEGELRFRCLYLKEVILRLSGEKERQEARAEDRKTKRRKPQGQPKDKDRELGRWRALRDSVEEEGRSFLGAGRLLSRQYLAGADLLFPQARASLLGLLDFALCLGRLHDLAFASKEERMLAVYESLRLDEENLEELFASGPSTSADIGQARQILVLARAEALAALGEHNRGVELVEEWMREQNH